MYVQGKKYAKSVIFIDIGQFRGGNFVLFSFLDGVGGGFEGEKGVLCGGSLFGMLFQIV